MEQDIIKLLTSEEAESLGDKTASIIHELETSNRSEKEKEDYGLSYYKKVSRLCMDYVYLKEELAKLAE